MITQIHLFILQKEQDLNHADADSLLHEIQYIEGCFHINLQALRRKFSQFCEVLHTAKISSS